MIRYVRITKGGKKEIRGINLLLEELSSHPRKLAPGFFAKVIRDRNVFLIAAKAGEDIAGVGTLILVRAPGGLHGRIEDVVVRHDFRGQGIGKALVQKLISLARVKKVDFIELTSNASRREANALYLKLGFSKRDTNVYRMPCK